MARQFTQTTTTSKKNFIDIGRDALLVVKVQYNLRTMQVKTILTHRERYDFPFDNNNNNNNNWSFQARKNIDS